MARTIPLIDDVKLANLARRIRPVIRVRAEVGGDIYREIEPVDPRDIAFTWDPKPVGPELVLGLVRVFNSYHNWGHYSLFKPSIAEVLAQIQDDELPARAFFWLDRDSVLARLVKPDEHNRSGYHRACCRLLVPVC